MEKFIAKFKIFVDDSKLVWLKGKKCLKLFSGIPALIPHAYRRHTTLLS